MTRGIECAAVAVAAALMAGACVNYDAGAEVLTGRAGIVVGLEVTGAGLPGSPSGQNVSGSLAGAPDDSLLLTIGNLPALAAGNAYQLWLVDETDLSVRRVGARHQIQRAVVVGTDPFTGEPIIEWQFQGEPQTVQSFAGELGVRHTIALRASDLDAVGATFDEYTHVVVTIGSGADANPLEAPAPAWYRYRNGATGQPVLSQPVRFGFRGDPKWLNTPWVPEGGGNVEFLNTTGFGLLLTRGARPPRGFLYEVWLVNRLDPNVAPLNVGVITTRPPEFQSLADADVTIIPDIVTETEVLEAVRWVTWAELGKLPADFTHVEVVLRSKSSPADVKPETIIYQVVIPANLDRLPVEREPRIRNEG